ncbi:MAG: prepilin-type N-terminal cleavage/methylation domain-containing protein [Candidatus Shapirobacteria bacterium]
MRRNPNPTLSLEKGKGKTIKKIKNKTGFTLIELIITITIIGVITALVTVSFASTSKRGRDSRRMADLEKIRMGLEMAKQVGGTYPSTLPLIVPTFLQQAPTDPKTGRKYDYQGSDYTYVLHASMEDPSMANGTYTGDCGTAGECNYEVTNP